MADDILHYGVKGMRWGVRKEQGSSEGSSRRDKVKRVAAGAAVVAGVSAVAYLAATGKMNVSASSVKPSPKAVKAVSSISESDRNTWNSTVKSFEKLISDAHEEQFQYMRRAMNDGGGPHYNPLDNPFTPQARAKQIGR